MLIKNEMQYNNCYSYIYIKIIDKNLAGYIVGGIKINAK